jgi:hypothetical protein
MDMQFTLSLPDELGPSSAVGYLHVDGRLVSGIAGRLADGVPVEPEYDVAAAMAAAGVAEDDALDGVFRAALIALPH